jgi:roadblock/LC7 domain-containing protein
MTNLDELLSLDGVVAAGEFASDGKLIGYKSRNDLLKEIADVSAQFCATLSMLFNTLAAAFSHATATHWIPQKVWSYSGGDWTIMIGANGNKGVFVETAKADFNLLFRALAQDDFRTE